MNKITGEDLPCILFYDPPFTGVVVQIEKDGSCTILKESQFLKNDPEWNALLQKKVERILNSL